MEIGQCEDLHIFAQIMTYPKIGTAKRIRRYNNKMENVK